MIYELRTYWAASGKSEALHQRFRSLTLRVFDKHQMQVVGFWTPETASETSGDLVYLLAFPDSQAMESSWTAFRADPEWVQGKAASEVDGPLTSRVASQVLLPTDYSPIT